DVEYSEFNSKENFNQFTTFLSTPLLLKRKIIGLLAVFYRDEKEIEEDDKKMLEILSHELSAAFEKCQQIDRLKKMTELKKALTHKVFKAQEDERKRIALSIHDDLLQTVVASLYRLSSWDKGKSKKLEIESGELESVMQILRDSVSSTRRLINDLRPPALDDLGLEPALRKLAKDTQKAGNINVEIKMKHILRLKPMQELIIYRIAQEALANCLKHSQADNALLKLYIYRKNLILTVKDDGKGIIVDRLSLPGLNGGLGIQAMKERALMAGGNIKIKKLKKGTEVKASIPLAAGVN
ncbi:MAG: GAF domain-containing sensor histidine kinase, partial [Actinomycetia bacterium]|nr:GAF domain-containing sensor histidine kinase [Actinomycetes bacterium]